MGEDLEAILHKALNFIHGEKRLREVWILAQNFLANYSRVMN